jgi:hypothetical protein
MSLFFSGPASYTRSGWRKPAVAVKRFTRAKRSRTFATIRMRPPRAAGVSQPWCTDVLVRRRVPASATTLAYHGGLTPAALGCVFASPRTLLDSHRTAFAFSNHGGLTPAALDSVVGVRRKLFASASKRDRLPNQGGLTVAALAGRAFVHRECRYFSADRLRAPGVAGVSQPWL